MTGVQTCALPICLIHALSCLSLFHAISPPGLQLPAPHSVALDMSLQTPSDVKVKEEEPVEVDSSPPGSPDSMSSMSDSNRESLVRGKAGEGVGVGRGHYMAFHSQ